ncbi:Dps family protein [Paracoccaceae bacterium GXU_MW_L88]
MTQTAETLAPDATKAICEALEQAKAETVVATMLAQNFHWNVTGMAFGPLHALFQTIYEDHFVAQDDLAERVRALGGHAEGKLSVMVKQSKIDEDDGKGDAQDMIRKMAEAERTLASTLTAAAAIAAENDDLLTEDLCIGRGRDHEKFAWLLSAHLD